MVGLLGLVCSVGWMKSILWVMVWLLVSCMVCRWLFVMESCLIVLLMRVMLWVCSVVCLVLVIGVVWVKRIMLLVYWCRR